MKEIGLTTVLIPYRMTALCVIGNLIKIILTRRGALVTIATAISAIGNMISPYQDSFTTDNV